MVLSVLLWFAVWGGWVQGRWQQTQLLLAVYVRRVSLRYPYHAICPSVAGYTRRRHVLLPGRGMEGEKNRPAFSAGPHLLQSGDRLPFLNGRGVPGRCLLGRLDAASATHATPTAYILPFMPSLCLPPASRRQLLAWADRDGTGRTFTPHRSSAVAAAFPTCLRRAAAGSRRDGAAAATFLRRSCNMPVPHAPSSVRAVGFKR